MPYASQQDDDSALLGYEYDEYGNRTGGTLIKEGDTIPYAKIEGRRYEGFRVLEVGQSEILVRFENIPIQDIPPEEFDYAWYDYERILQMFNSGAILEPRRKDGKGEGGL